ncbi:hypothetical protein [Deinococcus kurensis]|uniref:hypothetical protein n=1 Tax=Deinococcus kurensis TaxID=2662757 RepID=UPI0012D31A58|nr:hypothetical protein [Deinococcus kurensis]
MGIGKGTGKGGARAHSGPITAVPTGSGTKEKITVNIGSDQLAQLRALHPRLRDATPQDLMRAAVWAAIGEDLDRILAD